MHGWCSRGERPHMHPQYNGVEGACLHVHGACSLGELWLLLVLFMWCVALAGAAWTLRSWAALC